jgi:hypothetical protein
VRDARNVIYQEHQDGDGVEKSTPLSQGYDTSQIADYTYDEGKMEQPQVQIKPCREWDRQAGYARKNERGMAENHREHKTKHFAQSFSKIC